MATRAVNGPETVAAEDARRLLLAGAGLLNDPARRASPTAVRRVIEQLGFVQVDTISVVERAHHHILLSRLDDYTPGMLKKITERDRSAFEHWTHDASIIRVDWLPWWQVRFQRYADRRSQFSDWWLRRIGGEANADAILAMVLDRIHAQGPLMSKDFEHRRDDRQPWWGWKPAKAGLEFLWRSGTLSIAGRVGFQKVYDLTERVYPDLSTCEVPSDEAYCDWACSAAMERLGVASSSEVSQFLNAVSIADARAWCKAKIESGELVPVQVESIDGSPPKPGCAVVNWRERAHRARFVPDRMRLLSPFDPAIRDRKRANRLFGFDYRFEAFVPAAKRQYGYYVLPILDGDRLVGRVDPKLHRSEGVLEIKGVWWEPGIRPTRVMKARLEAAVNLYAVQIGAEEWEIPATR